jgi:hypothetical protein
MIYNLYSVIEDDKEIFCSCTDEKYFIKMYGIFRNHQIGLFFRKSDNIDETIRNNVKDKIVDLLADQKKMSQELLSKNTVDIALNDVIYECSFLKQGNQIDISQIVVFKSSNP